MDNKQEAPKRVKYNRPKKARIIVEKCPLDESGLPCDTHREGQVFEFDFERCPANFCAAAFHSLWPQLRVLELGGRHPWDKHSLWPQLRVLELGGRHPWDKTPGVTRVACPDPGKPTIFRIEVYDPEEEQK